MDSKEYFGITANDIIPTHNILEEDNKQKVLYLNKIEDMLNG